jgi:hypothetical protein
MDLDMGFLLESTRAEAPEETTIPFLGAAVGSRAALVSAEGPIRQVDVN